MAIAQKGHIQANYNPRNVEEAVAKDIVDTVFGISVGYPRDFFYNLAYPSLDFDLSKRNDELGYQMTLHGFGSVADPYLEFTKEMYEALRKKYRISIVFLTKSGELTFEYSKRNYWIAMLKNNLFLIILTPLVVMLMLWLNNKLAPLPIFASEGFFGKFLKELLPVVIGYPITLVAFKLQPKTLLTKIFSWALVLISVFVFYLCTGSGLVGSLILLGLFVLQAIQGML